MSYDYCPMCRAYYNNLSDRKAEKKICRLCRRRDDAIQNITGHGEESERGNDPKRAEQEEPHTQEARDANGNHAGEVAEREPVTPAWKAFYEMCRLGRERVAKMNEEIRKRREI